MGRCFGCVQDADGSCTRKIALECVKTFKEPAICAKIERASETMQKQLMAVIEWLEKT